jgi:hypothetical protein
MAKIIAEFHNAGVEKLLRKEEEKKYEAIKKIIFLDL